MALVMVKYGIDHPAAKLKLATAEAGDDVVLVQNGIYWVLEDVQKKTRGKVSVLKDDLLARGYPESATESPLIDYSGLVELIEKQENFIG
jgi:tRNA 2-thiouridine synthesizing protein B